MRFSGRLAAVAAATVLAAAGMWTATGALASGSGWSFTHTPNPSVRNGSFAAVSCVTAKACVAVGQTITNAGVQTPLAEQWNGSAWTVKTVASPIGALATALYAVSCSAATACTAVGAYDDNTGTELSVAERWNGQAWTVEPTPSPAGAGSTILTGVSCASATACTAVGSYANGQYTRVTLAEQWDGTAWTVKSTPNPSSVTWDALSGVSCSAPAACEAVGTNLVSTGSQTLAERWDGSVWTLQSIPDPSGSHYASLASVACAPASSSCMAVGSFDNGSSGQAMLAEQWNGTVWQVLATASPSGSFYSVATAVSCPSAKLCIAVGLDQLSSGQLTLAEKWDGSRWSILATKTPSGKQLTAFDGVSCPLTGSCMGVGASGQLTLAETWKGSAWSLIASVSPNGTGGGSFNGLSCVSASGCTAVGSAPGTTGLVEQWNGTKWALQATPAPSGGTSVDLTGVSCPAASTCTAVGKYSSAAGEMPVAEHWNGSRWAVQSTPTPSGATRADLSGVSCPSASTCTAVGGFDSSGSSCFQSDRGLLAERWDGTAWSLQTIPTPAGAACMHLSSVTCATATSCVAVGNYFDSSNRAFTLAAVWDGSTWTIAPNPSTGPQPGLLNGVACASPTTCIAVGADYSSGYPQPLAENWDGSGWAAQSTASPGGNGGWLSSVACATASACVAVGNGGGSALAEQWNGTSWTLSSASAPAGVLFSSLSAVVCLSTTACHAVGSQEYRTVSVPSNPGVPQTGGASGVTLAETFAG